MSTFPLSERPFSPERRSTPGARVVRSIILPVLVVSPGVAGAQTPRALHLPIIATHRTNVVTVVANDFAFTTPAAIPTGVTTFRLRDDARQAHHLSIVRLDSGKTARDGLAALIKAGHDVRPSWMHR